MKNASLNPCKTLAAARLGAAPARCFRAGAAALALLLALSSALLLPAPALAASAAAQAELAHTALPASANYSGSDTADDPLILNRGHVDLFCLGEQSATALVLSMCEDVTGSTTVSRDPQNVILNVPSAAWTEQTRQVPQVGRPVYALPQTQDMSLLWPGWSSLALGQGYAHITYHLLEMRHLDFAGNPGGGQVFMWQQVGFDSGPVAVDGSAVLHADSQIYNQSPAHQHVYWGFDQPGYYQMQVQASATNAQNQVVWSNPANYTWQVGADNYQAAPTPNNGQNPGLQPGYQGGSLPAPQPWGNNASARGTKNPPLPAPLPAPRSLGNQAGNQANGGKNNKANPGKGSGQKVMPKNGTGGASLLRGANGPASLPAGAAPGATASKGQAYAQYAAAGAPVGTRVGDSKSLTLGTHVHPNWVFTAPGTYQVELEMSTTLPSGPVNTTTTLNFNVGGAGNANEGHFDLGPAVENGQLQALVKDDSVAPAVWRHPGELVFGLGPNSQTTAPAGIEFIAQAGQDVWMVGSAQVPGVPWLGMNTQHPSLHETGAGDVTYTLRAVKGPGALAVFTSGNFGKTVGELWFGGLGSAGAKGEGLGARAASAASLSRATGSLAKTGIGDDLGPLGFLAGALLLAGGGMAVLRRTYRPAVGTGSRRTGSGSRPVCGPTKAEQ